MTNPRVTLGVPVYRGQETLPVLLECLRTQSYKNIDVLISVDGGDQASAEACKPFLRQDSRFRMHVQSSRLGWAGNTDWTMRRRSGDFYIYQQHDDLISPTYIADLVEASARWPNAVICFSKLQFTGQRDWGISVPSLLGDPTARALSYLRRLDWVPFRGLIRGSALDKTSGLLLSDFDPFDSLGTEWRFMAELSLLVNSGLLKGRHTSRAGMAKICPPSVTAGLENIGSTQVHALQLG
jgi:glycosyltransferase involved in cell wall biosynthesis